MRTAPFVPLILVLFGCTQPTGPARPAASGGDQGGEAGTGGAKGGAAGSPARDAAEAIDVAVAPVPDAAVSPADLGSPPDDVAPADAPAPAAGQGPTALGRIVYTQDFEQGMAGMSRSPTNLPVDRVQIVDDPLKQRGKVVQVNYLAGDNFRTSGGTEPRSWMSNASGYQIAVGTKISLAWGTMWPELPTNAFVAQTIGPGPVWELRALADGRFNVLCNKCGRNSYHQQMFPNRWYDLRVDMDWRDGGLVRFFIDGQMIHEATLSGASAACHWDGGIYWATDAPSRPSRTIFISNLSIGVRD